MIKNKEIINFLIKKTADTGFVNKLKIRYRPLICPFDKLLTYVNPEDKVFDIGCGSGQFISLMARFSSASEFYGIEISEELIRNAIEVNREFASTKNIEFSYFDGRNIPSNISSYNKIFMIDVLHHIPRKQLGSFLNGLYEKMSPGSELILKDIDRKSPLVLFNKIHDLVFSGEVGNEISSADCADLLKKTGFKITENFGVRTFVYPHYFVLCRK